MGNQVIKKINLSHHLPTTSFYFKKSHFIKLLFILGKLWFEKKNSSKKLN